MTALTEGQHAGEFILAEPERRISRETVTVNVPASTTLPAGSVLGVVALGGDYVQYDNAATDGRETAVAILVDNLKNEEVTAQDMTGVVVTRLAAVRRADLRYIAGTSAGDKTAAEVELASRFITVRD